MLFKTKRFTKVRQECKALITSKILLFKLKFISAFVAETIFPLREMPKAKGVC